MSRRHRQGTRVNEGPQRCELAARIVAETACSFCESRPGQRCISKPTPKNKMGQVLVPSNSHRARIETYWRSERDAS